MYFKVKSRRFNFNMNSKYKKIADILEEEIANNTYDNKIPTEENIMERFSVSRTTIRKAIDVLVKKGCVYQVQGSGVFVRKINVEDNFFLINIQNMNGLTKDFRDKKIETILLDFKLIKADKELSNKMKCNIDDNIYFVNRLRKIENMSYSIEYSYFNKNVIKYLNEDIANKSIYNYITDDLKLKIGIIDRTFYASKITQKDKEYLSLENDFTMLNESIAYLSSGEVFDFSIAILNDSVKFNFLSNITK